MNELQNIPLDLIEPNPIRMIEGDNINDLRESIRQEGVLQAILVRPKGKKYEIVFGNHRYFAAKGAGLKTIPAVVKQLSHHEAIMLSLIENVQRRNMNPYEEGRLFAETKIRPDFLAERLGKSEAYIRGRIAIFEGLNEDLAPKIGKTLTIGNARHLARLPKDEQIGVAERVENYRKAETGGKSSQGGVVGFGGRPFGGGTPCVCPICNVIHAKEWRKAVKPSNS